MAAIFNEPRFTNPDAARDYLESQLWPGGEQVCPHCASIGQHYKLQGKSARPGVYKCKDCLSEFSVTVGTIFEHSKVPLNTWLIAVHLLCSSKKGISSHQLHRMLGVSYKTAWFMTHRIREAMKSSSFRVLGGGGKTVEADEAYWGTIPHAKKNKGGGAHKMKIFSLVERDGEKRSFHVPNVTAKTLKPILEAQVKRNTHLMTDDAKVYRKMARDTFTAHSSVNHSAGEYARREGSKLISTNTVESSFAILKRGLYGTFHHVSEKHLQRYCTEFDFRWNNRAALGVNDEQRAEAVLRGVQGRRLTYRPVGETQKAVTVTGLEGTYRT